MQLQDGCVSQRQPLCMHLWGIWPACSLRKSFLEEGWPEFWSNGELTGQKRGAFRAKKTAHSAAGETWWFHGAAQCLVALDFRTKRGLWGRKGLASECPAHAYWLFGMPPLPTEDAEVGKRFLSSHLGSLLLPWNLAAGEWTRPRHEESTDGSYSRDLAAYCWISPVPSLLADSVRDALLINSFSVLVTQTKLLLKARTLIR